MKEAYKGALGLMFALIFVGGLSCGRGGGDGGGNPVQTVAGSGPSSQRLAV